MFYMPGLAGILCVMFGGFTLVLFIMTVRDIMQDTSTIDRKQKPEIVYKSDKSWPSRFISHMGGCGPWFFLPVNCRKEDEFLVENQLLQ